MRKVSLGLLVLVLTFLAGGVTSLLVFPHADLRSGSLDTVLDPSAASGYPTGAPSVPVETSTPSDPTTQPTTTAPTTPSDTPTTTAPTTPSAPATSTSSTPPAKECPVKTPLVDPKATPEAICLAATLDGWSDAGKYGAGQEINTSSQDYLGPISDLKPQKPAVVGFDLQELALSQDYSFSTPPIDELLQQAADGAVLTASWHATNPATGGGSFDRAPVDLKKLVEHRGYAAKFFWQDYDQKLDLLKLLQDGDGGLYPGAAVLFRPLHEANGNWFWWAQGNDPTDYKALYAALQQRAADRGVHNVVWGWSFNAYGSENVADASSIRPDKVDLVGIDTYENMVGRAVPDQQMNLSGLSNFAGGAPRIAVTEAGPQGSKDGNWDPRSVAAAAVGQGLRPAYVMMWFDDGDGSDGGTGKKQISSLQTGPAWLRTCPDGVCSLS